VSQPKKYSITAVATISVCIDVLADSEEEAIEKAQECGMQSLCWSCGTPSFDGDCPEWTTTGELDGDPVGPFSVAEIKEC
jgi:hypothetical protein